MKTLALVLTLTLTFAIAQAQVPQAMNYQAVARTSSGQIIPSQNIGVRFTVLNGSATGTVVYQETQNTTTNNFGLFTLAIGKGTPVTGTLAAVDWATGDKFLKVEIAPQGGTNYTLQGTTQFLSVPYALYSDKTKLLAGNNTITIANGNTISGNYQAGNNTILLTGNTIAGNYVAGNNTVTVTGNAIAGNYQAANNTVAITGNTIAGNYVPANNTVAITGNAIAGNYVPANNTVAITGNTIAGNYVPANNTIAITGNTIAGNYVPANNTVAITGNTIAANYQAGSGISITGNTITNTGTNLWIPDANGIHSSTTKVGVGANANAVYPLFVHQINTGVGHAVAFFDSDDAWQGTIAIRNNTSASQWTFVVSGNAVNHPLGAGAYGITNGTNFAMVINGTTNYIGIGPRPVTDPSIVPKSTLHVFSGDVNVEQIGSGIIMKSPNGQCWRVTVSNAGTFVATPIACP